MSGEVHDESPERSRVSAGAPKGFEPLSRTSPLLELLGPFYARGEGGDLVLGLRITEKHTNARGFAHGGVLLTLADVALGYAAEGSVAPPARLITASVSADFAGSAKLGDWVEARVDVQRVGGRMAFANAYLYVGERRVVRASAVFARADTGRRGEP
jgi:acyl-coenzyme A thioesterase 13